MTSRTGDADPQVLAGGPDSLSVCGSGWRAGDEAITARTERLRAWPGEGNPKLTEGRSPREFRRGIPTLAPAREGGLGRRRAESPAALGGLTLIEVLVSIVILSTGAVLVMQALARVSYAQMVAEHRTRAYLFALSKMAELEVAIQEGPLPEHDEGTFRVGEQAFRWNVTVAETPGVEDARAVSLAVAWRHGNNVFEHRFDTVLRLPAVRGS